MTPMMKQYLDIKKRYSHAILFYRLGDFYEMFFDDAILVSRELSLTLTSRDCGEDEKAPMCGVPYHSATTYINKLIEKGYKVAICEQMEEATKGKGIVKRDVKRVVTRGTNIESESLDESRNNFLLSIFESDASFGISFCDIATGEFYTSEIIEKNEKLLLDFISRISPVEIIANNSFSYFDEVKKCFDIEVMSYKSFSFDFDISRMTLKSHFHLDDMELFSKGTETEIISAGALITYLYETQKNSLAHITKIEKEDKKTFMTLDMASRRNLELTKNMKDGTKKGSLLSVIDNTLTNKGSRLLIEYLEKPLVNKNMILSRQNAVKEMKENFMLRDRLIENIKHIIDVDKILAKITYNQANGRDLLALKESLKYVPIIKELISEATSDKFNMLYKKMNTHENIYTLLDDAIDPECKVSIKDGNLIKKGYSKELDEYLEAKEKGTSWLLELETRQRELTGIKGLKIKYNKIFGYFIEVTNKDLKNVPDTYIRRQTMSNCERYIIDELKEIEEKILGADENISIVETKLFMQILNAISKEVVSIKDTMECISVIDVMISLAVTAEKENYVCPTINDDGIINIKDGRHPVVEKYLKTPFIPNNTYLDLDSHQVMLITGPNMAGKSTYMRQVALISILFQIGSFVPASSCDICIVDRVFTRVGASDDLWSGNSTFMVEMNEVANILNNATNRSLLILDEVGRGTSTFDGLSLAWSILERIADKNVLGAKTLFATHYHELTELGHIQEGINNYHVTIKKTGDDIIFLRKIEKGHIDHSYGLYVAKLAGIPEELIERSKEILKSLEYDERHRNLGHKIINNKGNDNETDDLDIDTRDISYEDVMK